MYQIQVETHSHTIVSNHAYSTLQENIRATKEAGMKGLCMTNHAPAIPDAPPAVHFTCLKYLPEEMEGIRFFKGAEANIIDYQGNLDLKNGILAMLDWVIASIHAPCLKPASVEEIQHLSSCAGEPLCALPGAYRADELSVRLGNGCEICQRTGENY